MISRIEALNYRCLRYVHRSLKSFQVLVGGNATGKSAFLDVVALLGDLLRMGLDEALLMQPGVGQTRGRATTVDELIFSQISDRFEVAVEVRIPEELQQKSGNGGFHTARYEVALGTKKRKAEELVIIGETFWLSSRPMLRRRPVLVGVKREHPLDGRPDQFSLFPSEPKAPQTIFLAPGRHKSPLYWRKVVNKSPAGNDYFQSETSKWNNIFRVGPRKAALANLPEDEARFPISMWVKNLLMEGIHVLALNSAAMRRPCSPSSRRTFLVDGSNLPLVVRDLGGRHPKIFLGWVEHIKTVIPDLESVEVRERLEDRHLYLTLRYRAGIEVPSWLLSDGTLRLLALTLLAYLPSQQGIYLIEEPENGIHPLAIEAVFQSLSSVYGGQVLLASHSPLVLGLSKPEQILCFGKTLSGATDIVAGDEHPRLRHWRGETDLATLYASGVLG
jgi:predicted ATPase